MSVLEPVTGTVQSVTDARPVTAVVEAVDTVVGALPLTGTLLGDDTVGTVVGPVTGVVDDTLGVVGGTVGTLPATVGDVVGPVEAVLPLPTLPTPVLPVPSLPIPALPTPGVPGQTGQTSPALPGGSTVAVPAPASAGNPIGPVVLAAVEPSTSVGPASDEHSAASTRSDVTVRGVAAEHATTVAAGSVTVDGTALRVPADGDRDVPLPVGGGSTGSGSGSGSGSAGAAPVGVDGTVGTQVSLAAGSRGTLDDDVVPASVVGDHDVAPD